MLTLPLFCKGVTRASGLEPKLEESKSSVLPLHHAPIFYSRHVSTHKELKVLCKIKIAACVFFISFILYKYYIIKFLKNQI